MVIHGVIYGLGEWYGDLAANSESNEYLDDRDSVS